MNRTGWTTAMVLAVAQVVATAVGQQDAPKPTVYEVYAIRYGTIRQMHVANLVAGADKARTLDIPLMFWLVKGLGRTILVDSGFVSEQLLREWKIADYQRPSDALARAGVKADEVTDLVVTHMHWDHAGGMTLFPKARVWIQHAEYSYYTDGAWQPKGNHGGIEPDDVLALVRVNVEGRLGLVEGDGQSPIAGISFHTGGRHTVASQYLVVNCRSGRTVLASDNVYLYENLDKHAPIAGSLDARSNLATQDRMRTQASDVRLIVPGHDPAVFTRFPTVAPGVVRID